jgi:hypothetical protein
LRFQVVGVHKARGQGGYKFLTLYLFSSEACFVFFGQYGVVVVEGAMLSLSPMPSS